MIATIVIISMLISVAFNKLRNKETVKPGFVKVRCQNSKPFNN
ncbi:hypothetical protein [Maribellus sp. CM-23]|nr:hypothetical protein [Maribellus sp. CM-23]